MSSPSEPSSKIRPVIALRSTQASPRLRLFSNLAYRFRALRKYRLGILVTVAAGIALIVMPLGDPFARSSYDLPFLFRTALPQTNIILVFADQKTLTQLGSAEDGTLDRQAHVELLSLLTAQRARIVLYDFLFYRTNRIGDVDAQLAAAIRANGNVILAAGYDRRREGGRVLEAPLLPLPAFRQAASAWGLFEFEPVDPDNCVRSNCTHIGDYTNATWIAVSRLNHDVSAAQALRKVGKWLNYYGPPQATVFETRKFHDVVETNGIPSDFFRDKIVFVGGRIDVGTIGALKDTFATPYSRFGFQDSPGLEIHATAFTNLTKGDWLSRMPTALQAALAMVWGLGLSLLLLLLPRGRAIGLTLVAVLVLAVASIVLQLKAQLWWSWLVPVIVQTPLALFGFILSNPLPTGPPIAFISYRREGGAETARLIRLALRDHRQNVFLDVEDLGPGRFDEELLRQIERAPNFIVILSPGALGKGLNEDDWIRKEIAHALRTHRRIIPIFKDNFVPPPMDSLPTDISAVPFHTAVIYSHQEFDATIARLLKFLK